MDDIILADSAQSRNDHATPICPPSATTTAYTFLRHIGFILDELCAQGLVLWLDDNNYWQWRWQGTDLKSTQESTEKTRFLALITTTYSTTKTEFLAASDLFSVKSIMLSKRPNGHLQPPPFYQNLYQPARQVVGCRLL